MITINFKLHSEIELPQDLIDSVPSSGRADDAISGILERYNIDVSLHDSREYLKRMGAWDDNELNDLEENKARLIWIAALDCQENDTVYFYMGG